MFITSTGHRVDPLVNNPPATMSDASVHTAVVKAHFVGMGGNSITHASLPLRLYA